MNYLRAALVAVVVTAVALSMADGRLFAQSFSCPFGKDPACLDYGDQVCSSQGMCVDSNAACFDQYQCGYEGFTCKSNVTECVDKYEDLLRTHNELVDSYNELLDDAKEVEDDLDDLRDCIATGGTVAEIRSCAY